MKMVHSPVKQKRTFSLPAKREMRPPVKRQTIIVAGDLRGDPLALLHILELSRAVQGVDFGAASRAIGANDFVTARETLRTMAWKETRETMDWTETQPTLVLLGDVLGPRSNYVIRDNVFEKRDRPTTLFHGSEELLMEMLGSLKQSGDVRWVLGDIDMQSITNQGAHNCADIHDTACDTGDATGMLDTYQKQARGWAQRFGATPLLVIDGLLFCHAALSNGFLARYNDCHTPTSLLWHINKDYAASVQALKRVPSIRLYGADVPEHCSLERMDNAAMERLGCRASFLGGRPSTEKEGFWRRVSRVEPAKDASSPQDLKRYHRAPDYTFEPVKMEEGKVRKYPIMQGNVYVVNTIPRIFHETNEALFGCAILTRTGAEVWMTEFRQATKSTQAATQATKSTPADSSWWTTWR
jgi:hypothetical protein